MHSTSPATDPATLGALVRLYTPRSRLIPGVASVESLVTIDPQPDAGGKAAYRDFYSAMGDATNPQAALARKSLRITRTANTAW